MKKYYSLILSAMICISTYSQQIMVSPAHLLCEYQVSEQLDNLVKSRLQRALTAQGIASEPGVSRFVLLPEVAITNETTTATVPVYCTVEFDLVISMLDINTSKAFSTYTIPLSGTGVNKQNAITSAISAAKFNNRDFVEFCELSKQKICNHYSANLNSIINSAQVAKSQRNFEEALAILAEIPEELPQFSSVVAPLMCDIYQEDIDLKAEEVLNEARAAWAKDPDEYGAENVGKIMVAMPAGSSFSKDAAALLAEIRNRVQKLADRQFAFEKEQADREYALEVKRTDQEYALERQKQRNEHDTEMATINAARAIGVAYAKNQPKKIVYNYNTTRVQNNIILW